jgi:hypothetical protein
MIEDFMVADWEGGVEEFCSNSEFLVDPLERWFVLGLLRCWIRF